MLSVDPPPSLSLPNEAVSINRYNKVIEAPQSVHRSQESDATSGTLPPYRTQPPSTHEASVSLEQPPYYRSHLPSTASRTGSSAGHDSKPKRRRSTKLVVANPSPSSTALSDALLQSTCCQPTPSTPDGHMGHQPAPRHDSETDEQTDHTLRLDQFTPGHQCQGPDEIERDEQIDENGDGDLGERDYSDYDGHRSSPTSLHCARSRARSHTVIRPSFVSAGIYGSPRGATKPPFRILAAGNASIAGSSYGRQAQISSQGRAPAPKYQVDSQADGNDAGSGRKPEAGKGTEGSERAADARGNAAVRSSSGARSSFARRVRDKLARGQLANKHSGLPVVRPNDVDEPYSAPSQAAPLHNFKSQRPSHRAASRHCSAECAQYTFTLSDLQTQELSSSDLSGPIQAGGQSMPTGTSSSVASSVRYPDNTFCNPVEVAAPASLSGLSGPTCAPSASSAAPDAGSPTSTMALLSATAPGPRAASSLVARPRPAASPRLQVQMPPRPRAARAPGSVMDRVMMLEQRVRAQEAEANSA
ncbi:hypothetical protein FA95DRAFT_156121 [Auriscalpium vulgare]|uniref:Uncharacterized protein n=1 Tax=Auriscalpium vulgare TaxID=40419 RepID=A0ACB8RM62_9AGAM|nr:hypothetical protein FA95DRAFT_156121 [Auriscalpium vulgare]